MNVFHQGDPDEIKFCLESKCKKCLKPQIARDECQSFDSKDNYVITKECCGEKINFEFCFTANTFLDHLASQSAFWSGPIGWSLGAIVIAVTENLTTFKISSTPISKN